MKKIYLLLISIFTLGAADMNAQNCQADFQFFPNNLTVNFQDSSFYTPNTFAIQDWNFGDGNVGSGTNPVHTYATAGTYTACLTIYDSSFACFDTICKAITVTGNTTPMPCNLTFSYSVNPNNTVSFTSTITGGTAPFTYYWNFGDSTGTSTMQNPTYTYSNTGNYSATMIVTDASGSTCSYTDNISVNNCSSYFTSSVGSNGTVSFTNQSNPLNAALINISWDFGDGNFSNVIHPTHTYTTSGLYTVTLNYFDSLTFCSSTYSDTINVQIGVTNSCNASYTIAKDSSLAYGVILYNTSSNFGSHFYTWDFGDGTTGSGRTPIHQYQNFGSYVVCLTITDSLLNCISTFCDTVGMDTLGNLKAGFGLSVKDPLPVGIDEINNFNNIVLFPNPATSQISIDLTAVQNNLNIQIMDVSGRVVMERTNQNPGNIEVFEISSLESGLYFMVLNNGSSEQKIEKFIKQ